jgi:hypothetical protein
VQRRLIPAEGMKGFGHFNMAFKPFGSGLANGTSDEREETFERRHGQRL